MPETANEATMAALTREGSVRSIRIEESGNGKYGVVAVTKMGERTLVGQRGDVRQFASLDTIAKYLRNKIGIIEFKVTGK